MAHSEALTIESMVEIVDLAGVFGSYAGLQDLGRLSSTTKTMLKRFDDLRGNAQFMRVVHQDRDVLITGIRVVARDTRGDNKDNPILISE